MSSNRLDIGRRAWIAPALVALCASTAGCATPTAPPAPPSGGVSPTFDFALFTRTVSPVLERHGCDAGGDCHGGGIRGTLQLSPVGAKDLRFDFDQVVLQVLPALPDSSPLLTRPLALAAGGTPHPFKPFASTADSDWIAIRAWVMAGVGR